MEEALFKKALLREANSPSMAFMDGTGHSPLPSPMTQLSDGLSLACLNPETPASSHCRKASKVSGRLMKCGLKVSSPSGGRRGTKPRRILTSESLDENNPPLPSPSKFTVVRQLLRCRTPLEDYDPNSQDSGYGVSEDSKSPANFKFVEPCGAAPRRIGSTDSPRRNLMLTFNSSSSSNTNSQGSVDDDGFLDLLQKDKTLEDENSPMDIGNLLSGNILNDDCSDISVNEWPTPILNIRRCVSDTRIKSVKRPLSELGEQQVEAKRLKASNVVTEKKKQRWPPTSPELRGTLFQFGFTKVSPKSGTVYSSPKPASPVQFHQQLSQQTNDHSHTIKLALQRCDSGENLIGDFTRPCALPLVSNGGKHTDLKVISSETLADLISGRLEDRITSYKIIDCRYPYEFEGGHIKGALNLYTQDLLKSELIGRGGGGGPPPNGQEEKRHILVFHCEFSFERGPKMNRYLRQEDRKGSQYPWLRYPEMYLLQGGYQAFYQSHSSLCEPMSYKPMIHPEHTNDLKAFRAKSKSWSHGPKSTRLSRLL